KGRVGDNPGAIQQKPRRVSAILLRLMSNAKRDHFMFFLRSRTCAGKSALLVGGLLLHSVGMSLNAQSQKTPEGYTDAPRRPPANVQNTKHNYAKLKKYGRIEWHGDTAILFAGNVRPLDEVAHTLSTCLGIPVSS